MLMAIRNSWALLFGMLLLMVGNGLQGTLLGVRGGAEGFAGATMGYIMSAYFIGFLGGTQLTPWLLRRVGHIRVFAAFASLVSAAFVLFASLVDPVVWFVLRLIVGLCFSSIYVVAESWLNDGATNETRGKTISAYIFVQMLGIISAQALLNIADPGGYDLFVLMSVLVSISFAPILLSSTPVPIFETTRRMTLGRLFRTSPLGCVGTFMLGAVFGCLFGMGAVYASDQGMTRGEISIFIGMIYFGGLICQIPIGWVSDRMDRRYLITIITLIGAAAAFVASTLGGNFWALTAAVFVVGGVANPLYSLLIAYVNDYLDHEDMASASAGLIMINGTGAMGAPIGVGYLMDIGGPAAFFWSVGAGMLIIAIYAVFRMTRRATRSVEDSNPIVLMSPSVGPVVADAAWEQAAEEAMENEIEDTDPPEPAPA